MCHPLAIGLGVGIFSAMANVSAAKSEAAHLNAVAKQKYELAKREAKRNNAIAQQEYENQLRIAGNHSFKALSTMGDSCKKLHLSNPALLNLVFVR